ncbi:MAG: quinoprotein relay system zinc metallohydrolase 2 [Alphaproteobacteria bacterium]|nr:quinoprotein relay system zinc metallohydrolase 2 [Alphaproteobacteria bacterium]
MAGNAFFASPPPATPRDRRFQVTRQAVLRGALVLFTAPLFRLLPALAATRLEVSEVAPGIFVHQGRYEMQSPENRGDMANAGFIVGDEAVAVIDTLGSAGMGRELREAIRAVTDKPVRYVINTHMHPDHVFGNAAFKDDNPAFVAHYKMARGLASRADRYLAVNERMMGKDALAGTEIVLPTLAVEDRLTLDLGNRELVLEALPTAHTDNDLIVTDTKTGTLFLGDLLFSVHVPTLDGSIRGWLTLIDDLEERQVARVVPGHGPHAMELPEAFGPEKRYLSTIAQDVQRLIREGKTLEDATKIAGFSERDAWKLFDKYHVRNVSAAFAELEWE